MRVVSVSPMHLGRRDDARVDLEGCNPPQKSNLPSLAISLFVIQAPRLQHPPPRRWWGKSCVSCSLPTTPGQVDLRTMAGVAGPSCLWASSTVRG